MICRLICVLLGALAGLNLGAIYFSDGGAMNFAAIIICLVCGLLMILIEDWA